MTSNVHSTVHEKAIRLKEHEIRKAVRGNYAKLAEKQSCCCSPTEVCAQELSKRLGYSEKDTKGVPEGSNLGLGCGNPVAQASIKRGEYILDLGSGAGFDCFLAAKKVGSKGKVIGVDMTPEMLERARENAKKGNYTNVEFRLGEIENLPVADCTVDVVISNCVINLSPDKQRIFREAYRVLKPRGRLMVSDIVLLERLPDLVMDSLQAYASCLAGAIMKDEYLAIIKKAGFQAVSIVSEAPYPMASTDLDDPTIASILQDLKISKEQALDMMKTLVRVESIAVNGHKP